MKFEIGDIVRLKDNGYHYDSLFRGVDYEVTKDEGNCIRLRVPTTDKKLRREPASTSWFKKENFQLARRVTPVAVEDKSEVNALTFEPFVVMDGRRFISNANSKVQMEMIVSNYIQRNPHAILQIYNLYGKAEAQVSPIKWTVKETA